MGALKELETLFNALRRLWVLYYIEQSVCSRLKLGAARTHHSLDRGVEECRDGDAAEVRREASRTYITEEDLSSWR